MIQENLTSWLGKPVADYKLNTAIQEGTIYRFRVGWEAEIPFAQLFAAYTSDPAAAQATALVIGAWFGDDSELDSSAVVELLVGAKNALPKLEALFFGDIISEENEISWINQTDVSPVLAAYPGLKHLVVRGGAGLSLGGSRRLESLQSLTLQTGGLPASVLKELWALDLPNLENLELWLGTDDYGWDGTVEDVKPLLKGDLFPKMKHLGLRNSMITNAIAEALITAPVVDRLESLDLSMGTLTDEGVPHLVACAGLKNLDSLDLHYHYCTDEGMKTLVREFPGVNVSEQQALDEYGPFVAVGE